MQLSERFEDALAYTARLHAAQVRKVSNIPYIAHLLAVAAIVQSVHREYKVSSKLVLDTQRELLHVRRVGVVIYDIHSNSEGAEPT